MATVGVSDLAMAAFPTSVQLLARNAANILTPAIDVNYPIRTTDVIVQGSKVKIPVRIHFRRELTNSRMTAMEVKLAIECLRTRSTDGYLRQAALRCILPAPMPWVVPFVVLLAGEYVVEIADELYAAIPALDVDIYARFVIENRPLIRLLRARAKSYWDCFYRNLYADYHSYPGLKFLYQLERWAA